MNRSSSDYEKVPTKELINDEKANVPAVYGIGVRHVQCSLLFLCLCIGFTARAHLGVTVVAMTNERSKISDLNISLSIENNNSIFFSNNNITSEVEFLINATANENNNKEDGIWNAYRTYEWEKTTQEMILSSFFLGYSLMMFPMGIICQRFGGKIPLQICLLVNGLVSLVTPTVAVWGGWKAVCCCRILQGISQAGLFPSAHTLVARWVPISERATFISYVYTGPTLGTIISFQFSGLLASSSLGWPSTFWLVGVACIVGFILITLFVAATPAEHKSISDKEKLFILGQEKDTKKRPKIPWSQILRSKPVYATLITHMFSGFSYIFLFTQIPTYMHSILGFNVKSSGLLSSLPYITSFIFSIVCGLVSDYCINNKIITLKTARRISNTIGQAGTTVCLVALTFTDNSTLAVALLAVAVGIHAAVHTGYMVTYIDMSPNFSGSLMAAGNTCTTLSSLSLPLLVSNIVTDVSNRYQWSILFFLIGGLTFCSNLYYVCFMSVETQPWNEINVKDDTEADKEEK